MAYVYRHIRLDKNQPFYIGIGADDSYRRANQKSKTKRSEYWHNIAKRGYEVEILIDGLTWEQACEKEKEFISLYGRADLGTGILCNLTCGGDNPPLQFGEKNPMKRKEVVEKVSKSKLGVKLSDEHKKSLSESAINRNVIPPSRKGKKMPKQSVKMMVESRLKNGLKRKVVYQYDKELNLINTWMYAKDIKEVNKNYSIGNIHSCCRGERKQAYGFIWSYKQLAGLTRRRKAEADLYFS
jgi:hypothetical protein